MTLSNVAANLVKPKLTLSLCGLTALAMLLPASMHAQLYFDRQMLSIGNLWMLVTGHWVHADGQHLLWNLLGLAVLGALIEQRSRRLLLLSLLIGTAAVDLLLLTPLCDLQRYCGLSGVLNTLLGVALYQLWLRTRSVSIIFVGGLCVAKIFFEMCAGAGLFTNISWPPYPEAHLAGFAATPVALVINRSVCTSGTKIPPSVNRNQSP